MAKKFVTVTVRGQIQRHPVEERGEVRAVIEIDAAQKVLVGFPAARVLCDNDAGHGFKDFAGTQNGAMLQLLRADCAMSGRVSNPDQTVRTPVHNCLLQFDRRFIL